MTFLEWFSSLFTGNSAATVQNPNSTVSLGKRPSSESKQPEAKRFKLYTELNQSSLALKSIAGNRLSRSHPSQPPTWAKNLVGPEAERFVKGGEVASPLKSSYFNVDSPRQFVSAVRRYSVVPPVVDISQDEDDSTMRRFGQSSSQANGVGKPTRSEETFKRPLSRPAMSFPSTSRLLSHQKSVETVHSSRSSSTSTPLVKNHLNRPDVEIVEQKSSIPPPLALGRMFDRNPQTPATAQKPPPPSRNGVYLDPTVSRFVTQRHRESSNNSRGLSTINTAINLAERDRFQQLLVLQSQAQRSGYTIPSATSHSGRSSALSDSTISIASSSSSLHSTGPTLSNSSLNATVFRSSKAPMPPYGLPKVIHKSYAAAVSATPRSPAENFYRATSVLKDVNETLTSDSVSNLSRSSSPEVILEKLHKSAVDQAKSSPDVIFDENGTTSHSQYSFKQLDDDTLDSILDGAKGLKERKPFDEAKLASYRHRRSTLDPSELTRSIKEDYKPFMVVTNTKVSRHEDELEMRRKARVIEGTKERQLEEIRRKLRLEGFGHIEEESEEEDEFPELTDEQVSTVTNAFNCRNPSQVLVEEFSIPIKLNDIKTLQGTSWLNDEVINFYFNLIVARSSENEKLPKCYAFNTFFLKKLQTSGYSLVKRWTKKVDVFSNDLLFVPVHLGNHWCLAVVDFRVKKISYYDSMGGSNDAALKCLLQYLQDESMDKKKLKFDTFDWKTENRKDVPQQMNGSDCGMFACKFAEYLSRDAKITFAQANMPYFRQRMVYEILSKKLM